MNGKPVKEIPIVPRRAAEDEHAEGCLCDEPVAGDEVVEDEHLPETGLVPGLDKSPRAPRAKK